jgi:hypothetical protein
MMTFRYIDFENSCDLGHQNRESLLFLEARFIIAVAKLLLFQIV